MCKSKITQIEKEGKELAEKVMERNGMTLDCGNCGKNIPINKNNFKHQNENA